MMGGKDSSIINYLWIIKGEYNFIIICFHLNLDQNYFYGLAHDVCVQIYATGPAHDVRTNFYYS